MLKNRDIIVFSDDWGRHPSSCQHLLRRFLPDNRVVWVNTIGMRSPRLSLYDIKRGIGKMGGWLAGDSRTGASEAAGPVIVDPVIIPYNHIGPVRSLNRELVMRKLRALMAREGIAAPLLITTFPCAADYMDGLNECARVYYCVDDFTQWPGVNSSLIAAMEEKLLAACDLVLASSDTLCDAKTRSGKRPALVPHGVEVEHFSVRRRSGPQPALFAGLSGPIIGFFGAVSEWIDFALVKELSRQRPSWSFVFIGPVDTNIEEMSGIGNVRFLGPVPYDRLPAWASFFDVGLIPFVVNELTMSVNPLKLLEYLALGLPVVSVDLPEIRKFSEVVSIAAGPEEFLTAIETALAGERPELELKRRERARSHSWEAAAELMSRLIEELPAVRGADAGGDRGAERCGVR